MARIEHLTLSRLRRFDEKLDRVADDVREIKGRISILEQQYASVSRRIDRIEARLEQIESGIELVNAT